MFANEVRVCGVSTPCWWGRDVVLVASARVSRHNSTSKCNACMHRDTLGSPCKTTNRQQTFLRTGGTLRAECLVKATLLWLSTAPTYLASTDTLALRLRDTDHVTSCLIRKATSLLRTSLLDARAYGHQLQHARAAQSHLQRHPPVNSEPLAAQCTTGLSMLYKIMGCLQ
jgi:hypothetical protein